MGAIVTMQNPSDLDGQPLDLLIKILRMTESDNDNIALSAIRRANAQLAKLGADWDRLLRGKVKIIADPFANINIPGMGAVNPNRNQPYTPPPAPPPPAPPRTPAGRPRPPRQGQATVRAGHSIDTLEKTIVNIYEGTCSKCQNRVLAGEGLATLWKRSDGKTYWKSEHATGQCPPTRKFKPATTTDDLQI